MLKYHNIWLAGGYLLIGLVLYLSLTPHPPQLMTFGNSDKLEHAFAYASLSLWFCQLYRSAQPRVIVMTVLIGLGVGLEYVQGWTGYRTFEVNDMLADGFGVLLGWLLVQAPLGRMFVYIESLMASRRIADNWNRNDCR